MTRTVNVTIVAIWCFVFDVSRVDCNTTESLFWGFVDFTIVCEFGTTLFSEDLCDSSS